LDGDAGVVEGGLDDRVVLGVCWLEEGVRGGVGVDVPWGGTGTGPCRRRLP
jgi:hypothetical protein